MRVEVIVPWRGGCPHRDAARSWVTERYAEHHPEWRVRFMSTEDRGPWVKAKAVMPAVRASRADVIVVADADVWTDGLEQAVRAIVCGVAEWAIPHAKVYRLAEAATGAVLAGEAPSEDLELAEMPRDGVEGGGLVVSTRATLLDVPLDPRFVGWGQEDSSLGVALHCLAGPPWRGVADLFHLWHPPQQRLDRRWGSFDGKRLHARYVAARENPDAMRALIAEVTQ